ncbi:NXPE family member 3-like [Branchiostoma lanceolatum]|uniref:NXPE family member 3-like n=1 Tax=Branchiostoma lanceolatum TaxID=7740 RepID=UPI0034537BA1
MFPTRLLRSLRCCLVLAVITATGYVIVAHLSRPHIQQRTQHKVSEEQTIAENNVLTSDTLYWPKPPTALVIGNKLWTGLPITEAKETTYSLDNPKTSYHVGDFVNVTIVARDKDGQPKIHGGDYFQVRVQSPDGDSAAAGQVIDHDNGKYTAQFRLFWAGEVKFNIRLVHPSEGCYLLNYMWEVCPLRLTFTSTFMGNNGSSETTECNVFLDEDVDQCDYSDQSSGVSWACVKPKTLPCSSRVDHKVDYDLSHHLNKLCFFLPSEQRHMISSLVTYDEEKGGTFKKTIKGRPGSINVNSTYVPIKVSLRRPPCESGIPTPSAPTTGFWHQDVWTSTVCKNRHFPRREHYFKCLENKELYFMGDSTGRQLYEFLVFSILNTTFSAVDPSITRRAGPHYAVHKASNLTLRFRVHGPPLRTGGINVTHINYLADEISIVRGGPDYVIIITMWAHFTSFHYDIYIQRLRGIRTAILNLLYRKPDTLIVFKTASTRTGVPRLSSDFFSSQMNKIIRKMFANVKITILDVWDLTLSHKNEDIIHPKQVIVRQEVELLLSYICPS